MLDLRLVDYLITAKVQASMKDKSHAVSLTVSRDGGILSAVCQCPRGTWICSHMAAAAIFANRTGLSKTDLPSSWITKPKKATKIDSQAIADFFPHPKPSYRATSRKATQQDKELFHRKLAEAKSDCPFQWMSGPEPGAPVQRPEVPCLLDDILNIFFSDKAAFIDSLCRADCLACLVNCRATTFPTLGEGSKTSSDRRKLWRGVEGILTAQCMQYPLSTLSILKP